MKQTFEPDQTVYLPDGREAIYRIAKHPTRGAYPFFRDLKAMIALRHEVSPRENP